MGLEKETKEGVSYFPGPYGIVRIPREGGTAMARQVVKGSNVKVEGSADRRLFFGDPSRLGLIPKIRIVTKPNPPGDAQ